MKKITEKEKAQLTDEERIVYFNYYMLRWARTLVIFRSAYRLFVKNKEWILSLLFILSIDGIKMSYILYSFKVENNVMYQSKRQK